MGSVKYQDVKVTLSAATFSWLQQATPFDKRRVTEQAIEEIRVALYTMYPPRTPEDWQDRSRFQGAGRHMLHVWYDLVCYFVHKWTNGDADSGRYADDVSEQPTQITLKIPVGLVTWIEKIARSRQSTIPEATVYAIEYGLRVLDSQQGQNEWASAHTRLRDIFRAIWKRLITYFKAVRI